MSWNCVVVAALPGLALGGVASVSAVANAPVQTGPPAPEAVLSNRWLARHVGVGTPLRVRG